MSAMAPLGRPNSKTGRVEAACTIATHIGEVVIDVISQAAATSFIHMHRLAISQVLHSMRNAAILSGAKADCEPLPALPAGSAVSSIALIHGSVCQRVSAWQPFYRSAVWVLSMF